jgi:hypothetical protein
MIGWEILYGVGALVLFVGLAYGAWQYHTRDRRKDALTEAATRAEYDHPDADPRDLMRDPDPPPPAR